MQNKLNERLEFDDFFDGIDIKKSQFFLFQITKKKEQKKIISHLMKKKYSKKKVINKLRLLI